MIIKHYDVESMIAELKGNSKEVRIQALTSMQHIRYGSAGEIIVPHNSYEIRITAWQGNELHEFKDQIALERDGETKRNYNARKRMVDAEQLSIHQFKRAGFKVLKGEFREE